MKDTTKKLVTGLIFARGEGAQFVSATLQKDETIVLVQNGHTTVLGFLALADMLPRWAAECWAIAAGEREDATFALGPVGLVMARRHAQRHGLGIGTDAAHALHVELGDARVGDQKAFAAKVLGRRVLSFTCLSHLDAQRLRDYAAFRDVVEGEVAA